MSDKPSQKRKREAATDLRALAGELQLNDRGRNADLNAIGFCNDLRAVPYEAVKTSQQGCNFSVKNLFQSTFTTTRTCLIQTSAGWW